MFLNKKLDPSKIGCIPKKKRQKMENNGISNLPSKVYSFQSVPLRIVEAPIDFAPIKPNRRETPTSAKRLEWDLNRRMLQQHEVDQRRLKLQFEIRRKKLLKIAEDNALGRIQDKKRLNEIRKNNAVSQRI